MKKPMIAVVGATASVPINPTAPVTVDFVNDAYCQAIIMAGGIPVIIPVQDNVEDILPRFDGLFFPGGEDVDPKLYGEEPSRFLTAMNEHTDNFAISAVKYAVAHSMPILGICRGMQIVNVALGGSLYQDLMLKNPNHALHSQRCSRDYLTHNVHIEDNTLLVKLLGQNSIYTNTMHHQCVKDVGEGLKITAATKDEIPEAMENNDGSILLVQWHPEELLKTQPIMINIFKHFIDGCN